MSNIPVQKVRQAEALPRQLSEEMETISEQIRKRAYELFLMRGATPNRDLDDWLQAERQIMWLPDTELLDKEREFQARINVSGLDPKDLRIIALPNSIVLQAEPKSREAKLFQRLDFPAPIDPDRVTARLEKGILQVVAPKDRERRAAAA